MRFLIIDAEYPEFVYRLYTQNPELKKRPFEEQMRFRNDRLYGMADFYSSNLIKLGHEADDVWTNNEIMQRTWAKEHGVHPGRSARWNFRLRRGFVPWVSRVPDKAWLYKILAAQIEHYKPDVLLNMMVNFIPTQFLEEIKPHVRLLMGWGSPPVLFYPQDGAAYRRVYDVIVAPAEGMVDHFRSLGVKAELLRHAFEPRVLSAIGTVPHKTIPVSFVGLLRGSYSKRRDALEVLCTRMSENVFVWASSLDDVPANSSIRKRYQGNAWGRDLYRVLSASKVTWNSHHELAGEFADNLRMYEATGVGTCLVNDQKKNLHKIFEIGKEVVAYRTSEEAVELIQYYLEHETERTAIALAGQQRTLREHTYWHRAQQLVDIVQRHL